MSANTGAPEPVGLFEFLRSLEVAAHHNKVTRMQERVARLTAMDSTGTSGGGVVLNVDRTATELGVTTDRIWVHFRALVAAGWFVQTVKPTRGTGKTPGRRARYQCMRPVLDLGLASAEDLRVPETLPFDGTNPVDNSDRLLGSDSASIDEEAQNRLLVARAATRSDSPTQAESSIGFDHNRLLVLAESSIGAERGNNRLSTSDGSTSDELPSNPVPQQPKPQDAREPVDKSTADIWADTIAGVQEKLAAAAAISARHARPAPVGNVRPDRE